MWQFCFRRTATIRISLVAQMVKGPPAMQETRVQSLGQEDPLQKEMATYSSTLVWKIPWLDCYMLSVLCYQLYVISIYNIYWYVIVHGVSKTRTQLSDFTFTFFHFKVWCVQLLEEFKERNMHPGLGNWIGYPRCFWLAGAEVTKL